MKVSLIVLITIAIVHLSEGFWFCNGGQNGKTATKKKADKTRPIQRAKATKTRYKTATNRGRYETPNNNKNYEMPATPIVRERLSRKTREKTLANPEIDRTSIRRSTYIAPNNGRRYEEQINKRTDETPIVTSTTTRQTSRNMGETLPVKIPDGTPVARKATEIPAISPARRSGDETSTFTRRFEMPATPKPEIKLTNNRPDDTPAIRQKIATSAIPTVPARKSREKPNGRTTGTSKRPDETTATRQAVATTVIPISKAIPKTPARRSRERTSILTRRVETPAVSKTENRPNGGTRDRTSASGSKEKPTSRTTEITSNVKIPDETPAVRQIVAIPVTPTTLAIPITPVRRSGDQTSILTRRAETPVVPKTEINPTNKRPSDTSAIWQAIATPAIQTTPASLTTPAMQTTIDRRSKSRPTSRTTEITSTAKIPNEMLAVRQVIVAPVTPTTSVMQTTPDRRSRDQTSILTRGAETPVVPKIEIKPTSRTTLASESGDKPNSRTTSTIKKPDETPAVKHVIATPVIPTAPAILITPVMQASPDRRSRDQTSILTRRSGTPVVPKTEINPNNKRSSDISAIRQAIATPAIQITPESLASSASLTAPASLKTPDRRSRGRSSSRTTEITSIVNEVNESPVARQSINKTPNSGKRDERQSTRIDATLAVPNIKKRSRSRLSDTTSSSVGYLKPGVVLEIDRSSIRDRKKPLVVLEIDRSSIKQSTVETSPIKKAPIIKPVINIPKPPIQTVPKAKKLRIITDFCSDELLCSGKRKNIMCNAEAKFGPLCRNASHVPITDDIRNLFLRIHNEKRSLTAQGKLEKNDLGTVFGTAVRMATMIWDWLLQRSALQNAFSCDMKHDDCHRTLNYVYAGQNLARSCADLYYQNVEDVIINALNAWFNEHKDLPLLWFYMNGRGPPPRDQVTHFTQMVRDKAFSIGCSIIKSMTFLQGKDWHCFYIACNYATTNYFNLPVYTVGPIGEKCTTGMNPDYPGLCSVDENYYDDTHLFQSN